MWPGIDVRTAWLAAIIGPMLERGQDSQPHWVYVIEIAPKWIPLVKPSLDPGTQCLYVGETSHPPGKRFHQHRRGLSYGETGANAAARPFQRIRNERLELGLHGTLVDGEDAWLRRDLMESSDPVGGDEASKSLELETAERLRSVGFHVFGPKPKAD